MLRSNNLRPFLRTPQTLYKLSISNILESLPRYSNQQFENLKTLPTCLKNVLLTHFMTFHLVWQRADLAKVLDSLVSNATEFLHLSPVLMNPAMLKAIQQGKNIKILCLSKQETDTFTSQDLIDMFSCLPNLLNLELTNCDQLTDDVLKCLGEKCPKLNGLEISGCKKFTDDGLKHFENLELVYLNVSSTSITDVGLNNVFKKDRYETLKELRIDVCQGVTQEGLSAISKKCINLEIVIFDDSPHPGSHAASVFYNMSLRNLKVLSWNISW